MMPEALITSAYSSFKILAVCCALWQTEKREHSCEYT